MELMKMVIRHFTQSRIIFENFYFSCARNSGNVFLYLYTVTSCRVHSKNNSKLKQKNPVLKEYPEKEKLNVRRE
jgi:hypothetical protein